MTKAPLAILAAGGTGGHMFPAQALAEALLEVGWRVKLTTDPRGARYVGGFPDAVQVKVLKSGTFARGGSLTKAFVPFQIAGGSLMALAQMIVDRPIIVIGFGGYPSIPALTAATILRIVRMTHEQNGVLGRVNQLFAPVVNAVACGTWPTEMSDKITRHHVGNPVRAAIAERAGAGYIPPGDYPMSILILGGSQGARILSDVVPPAIAGLPMAMLSHIRVSHQARPEDQERVEAYYADQNIPADVRSFFDDIPTRMSEAQLVISRAGASTVADISVIGRPSLLVPLAVAIRDEQSANAMGLVSAGAAELIREPDFQVDYLTTRLEAIFNDPARASQMASAALKTSVPDATQRLMDLIQTFIKKDT